MAENAPFQATLMFHGVASCALPWHILGILPCLAFEDSSGWVGIAGIVVTKARIGLHNELRVDHGRVAATQVLSIGAPRKFTVSATELWQEKLSQTKKNIATGIRRVHVRNPRVIHGGEPIGCDVDPPCFVSTLSKADHHCCGEQQEHVSRLAHHDQRESPHAREYCHPEVNS